MAALCFFELKRNSFVYAIIAIIKMNTSNFELWLHAPQCRFILHDFLSIRDQVCFYSETLERSKISEKFRAKSTTEGKQLIFWRNQTNRNISKFFENGAKEFTGTETESSFYFPKSSAKEYFEDTFSTENVLATFQKININSAPTVYPPGTLAVGNFHVRFNGPVPPKIKFKLKLADSFVTEVDGCDTFDWICNPKPSEYPDMIPLFFGPGWELVFFLLHSMTVFQIFVETDQEHLSKLEIFGDVYSSQSFPFFPTVIERALDSNYRRHFFVVQTQTLSQEFAKGGSVVEFENLRFFNHPVFCIQILGVDVATIEHVFIKLSDSVIYDQEINDVNRYLFVRNGQFCITPLPHGASGVSQRSPTINFSAVETVSLKITDPNHGPKVSVRTFHTNLLDTGWGVGQLSFAHAGFNY